MEFAIHSVQSFMDLGVMSYPVPALRNICISETLSPFTTFESHRPYLRPWNSFGVPNLASQLGKSLSRSLIRQHNDQTGAPCNVFFLTFYTALTRLIT
jgi:hypothetical protein